jgi:hypothetical protein
VTQYPGGRTLTLFVRQRYCFSFPSNLELTQREKGNGEGAQVGGKIPEYGAMVHPTGNAESLQGERG